MTFSEGFIWQILSLVTHNCSFVPINCTLAVALKLCKSPSRRPALQSCSAAQRAYNEASISLWKLFQRGGCSSALKTNLKPKTWNAASSDRAWGQQRAGEMGPSPTNYTSPSDERPTEQLMPSVCAAMASQSLYLVSGKHKHLWLLFIHKKMGLTTNSFFKPDIMHYVFPQF
jgi:hypothetical protein